MEHAIGTKITLGDDTEIVVEEYDGWGCDDCVFACDIKGCEKIAKVCRAEERTDHNNIIYKVVEEE